MFERFADETRALITAARTWATDFVDVEHLYFALLESRVAPLLPPGPVPARPASPTAAPFSPRAKAVVEAADAQATELGHAEVRLEHVLLAILPLRFPDAEERDRLRLRALALLARAPERNLSIHTPSEILPRPELWNRVVPALTEGRCVALVGPKGAGKTSLILGLARSRAAGFVYRSIDFRLLDPLAPGILFTSWGEGIVRYMSDADLLATCRTEVFDELFARPVHRLILEFRDEAAFERRYSMEWVKLRVEPPGPAESAELIRSAFPDASAEVLEEAIRLSAERIASPRPPWSTIRLLRAAGPAPSLLSVRHAAGL